MTGEHLLLRRSEVFRITERFRDELGHLSIEEIADRFDVHVHRTEGAEHGPDGVAIVEAMTRPLAVASLVDEQRVLPVWGGVAMKEARYILLNTRSKLPEREIWWHEFYHILFSPRTSSRQVFTFDGSRHEYRVEERRADDFAAAMLVPSIAGLTSLEDIIAQYNVSKRLARHALELHVALSKEH